MPTSFSAVSSSGLHALLGALPDAVLAADDAGKVVFLNSAAELLTGRASATALGRSLEEVLPLADESKGTPVESPAAICLRVKASVGPFVARLHESVDRTARIVDVSAAPVLDPDGTATGTILIVRDITHARQVARQLSHRATHDALTGLVNRTEFERRLTQALASASKEGSRHAIGFLDLDGFKRINDACGHLAGDEMLQQLSELLRGGMRARDTVARLGGDEFGILFEHCSPAKAVRIAEEIRKIISDHPFTCEGRTFSMGASIGIVPVRPDGASPTQLIRAADAACYQAKHQGGNRVQLSGVPEEPSPVPQRLFSNQAKTSETTFFGSHPQPGSHLATRA